MLLLLPLPLPVVNRISGTRRMARLRSRSLATLASPRSCSAFSTTHAPCALPPQASRQSQVCPIHHALARLFALHRTVPGPLLAGRHEHDKRNRWQRRHDLIAMLSSRLTCRHERCAKGIGSIIHENTAEKRQGRLRPEASPCQAVEVHGAPRACLHVVKVAAAQLRCEGAAVAALDRL